MFDNQLFAEKKVLITGCTGFKGSWLSIWLNLLGAKIYGLALDPPTNPSLYKEAKLKNIVENNVINLQDSDKVSALIKNIEPYDMYDADEAFVTGTPFCILPVCRLNNLIIGDGKFGSISKKLIDKWSKKVNLDIIKQMKDYYYEFNNPIEKN